MSFLTSNIEGGVLLDWFTPSLEYPSPPFAVGTIAFGANGSVWHYVQASAAVTAGFACQINPVNNTIQHVTTANSLRGYAIGVPAVSIPSGSFGWVQRAGQALIGVQMLASAAINARLNTTATAGAIDDDATVGAKEIVGLTATTANGGSAALTPAVLSWPLINATL
jgi:hypothetical protein